MSKKKLGNIFEGYGAREVVIVGGAMLGAYFGLQYLEGNGGGEGGLEGAPERRAGGILGSTTAAPGITVTPGTGFTGFPAQTDYSDIISRFFTPEQPTETPARAAAARGGEVPVAKKEATYEELSAAYDVHYGTYESKGYKVGDIAFERGKKEEIMNIMTLQSHPTLMHDPTGRIVKRPKTVSPAEQRAEAAYQQTVAIAYGRSGGGGGSTSAPKKAVSTPKKRKPTTYRAVAGGGQVAI